MLTPHILLFPLSTPLCHSLWGHRNYHHMELKDLTTMSNVVKRIINLRVKGLKQRGVSTWHDSLNCYNYDDTHSRKLGWQVEHYIYLARQSRLVNKHSSYFENTNMHEHNTQLPTNQTNDLWTERDQWHWCKTWLSFCLTAYDLDFCLAIT